ncbi:DNA-3-methyladenine glycosylase 2 family protein, partial [Pseudonocardia sp. McavD-2-B]|nr:DNA-3-methyladenine glycosylase 2 family protein [Pseudonocardia sp. McavD-2-B]
MVDREWRPPFPLDLYGVLAPLRRGRGDPTWRTAVDGAVI